VKELAKETKYKDVNGIIVAAQSVSIVLPKLKSSTVTPDEYYKLKLSEKQAETGQRYKTIVISKVQRHSYATLK
jgi:hypothetical protein